MDDENENENKNEEDEEDLEPSADSEEKDEGDDDEEEDEEENPLAFEHMVECLSLLCKTGDGLGHAFVRLDISDRDINDVSILKTYEHLRYLELSKNNLKDIEALNALQHLLSINCDFNKLRSAALVERPYLQEANFANNRIEITDGLNHPMLETLNMNYNRISRVTDLDANKLNRLHTLELRGNKLTSTEGFKSLVNLKKLYLAKNNLDKLEDLDQLKNLELLHLRENKFHTLDGFSEGLVSLQYLNLRMNKVDDYREVEKLQSLLGLRSLILYENPLAEMEEYRMEVLVSLRTLERLDKDEFADEEKEEAEEIFKARLEEKLEQDQVKRRAIGFGDEGHEGKRRKKGRI